MTPLLIVGGLGVLAAIGYAVSKGGSSSSGGSGLVPSDGRLRDYAANMDESQLAILDIIDEVGGVEYGYNLAARVAAALNGMAESSLNPDAYNGDGEESVGLFQANRNGGLGSGHSVEDLKDPYYNTRVIFTEVANNSSFNEVYNTYPDDIPKLTWSFTYYIERPADRDAKGNERAATLSTYFPGLAGNA